MLDFKDLEMIQNSLENEIDHLNNQVVTTEDDKEIIDEYIKSLEESQEVQDSYLFSIIQPKEEPSNVSALKILYKNRLSFIEGKLAAENNMRFDNAKDNGGIWFPSGAGIDGDGGLGAGIQDNRCR